MSQSFNNKTNDISVLNEKLNNTLTFRESLSRILHLFLYSRDDESLNKALETILNFFQADRVYLRLFNEDNSIVLFSHDAKRDDIPDIQIPWNELESHPFKSEIKWLTEETKKGNEIIINDVDNISPDLLTFQNLMKTYGIKSSLVLPTKNLEQINGYIGIDFFRHTHIWDFADVERLRILSDIFSNALEHERVEKEKRLSELRSNQQEAIFKIVFDKLPVGIEIYDEKGILHVINPAGLEILGTTNEKVLGVNLFDNPLISQESKDKMKRGEEVIIENSYCFNKVRENNYYESEYRDIDKSLLGICTPLKDSQNKIYGYLQLVHDNTEDFKRKEELEYNLTKLRMALDTGKAMIWEYDVENDKLTYDDTLTGDISSWVFDNSDNSQMFTSKGQIQGLYPDDQDRFFNQAVLPLLNGEINQITITYRQYLNGKLEWLTSNFRTSSSLMENGKPSKVFCYSMIITEQREMELEFIRIKEADKLKTLFIENLSHEIRTPLNAIIGFSNIIAESNRSKENEVYVDLIRQNNEHLLNLVDNMLDLSNIETGEIKYSLNKTDIKVICLIIYEEFLPKMNSSVKLHFDVTSPSCPIYSDERRIKQVLTHLLDNALKFTAEGDITLSYTFIDEDFIRISVKDTGRGITDKEKLRLFSPFYQTDSFKKGTGIGLHISQKIVTALGGSIGFESEEGKGSDFWFTLPVNKKD